MTDDVDLGVLAESFSQARALAEEARARLDAIANATTRATDVVDEARRVTGGLLQVLPVLNLAGEEAVKNQDLLRQLLVEQESAAPPLRGQAVPTEELTAVVADVVRQELVAHQAAADSDQEVVKLLREAAPEAWLPTLHRYISGAVGLAAAEAVEPMRTSLDELLHAVKEVQRPEFDLGALQQVISQAVRVEVTALVREQALSDAVPVRLDAIEKLVKTAIARRETPSAVGRELGGVVEKLDALLEANTKLASSLTKVSAKQTALDKRLATIDDSLIEMAKDIEDVYATVHAMPPPTTAVPQPMGEDVLPNRSKRRLFKA